MAIKLLEYTYGTHIFMRMQLDNGRIEEIDVYLISSEERYYVTSADSITDLEERKRMRNKIIATFNELY